MVFNRLTLIKNKLTITSFKVSCSYHSDFNPKCYTNVRLNSVKPRIFGDTNNMKLHDIRMAGIPIQLSFYDSHRFDKSTRYNQASQPTMLLLPSSEKLINDYDVLIGELVKKDFRVLSLEFPGFGGSKLVENDNVYKHLTIQKATIVHDFLNFRIPHRKRPLNGIIGFGDNSYIITLLQHEAMAFFAGNNSSILVNPAPPKYITELKKSKILSFLDNYLSRNLSEELIRKHLKKTKINLRSSEVFNTLQAWKHIDIKTIDKMLMSNNSDKTLIILNENEIYDQDVNKLLMNYFQENEFGNFKKSVIVESSETFATDLAKTCEEKFSV